MIEKGNLISEGKAKSLYETQNQNELLMVYRDDTSAFDGKKKEALKGKGEINNKFNAHIMQYLDKNGISLGEKICFMEIRFTYSSSCCSK